MQYVRPFFRFSVGSLLLFLALVLTAEGWPAPHRAEGAAAAVQATKRAGTSRPAARSGGRARAAKRDASRRRSGAGRPESAILPPRSFTLSQTGLQPASGLLLSDPVMNQLRAVAKPFVEAPTPLKQRELERFAAAHTNHPAGALAYLALGYAALQGKSYAEAVRYLTAGRGISSPVPDYFDYYLAHVLAEQQRYREAADLLEGFEQRYPDSSLVGAAVLQRSEGWIFTGRATAATQVLKSRLGALHRPEADLLLGRAYAAAGDLPAAIEAYRQAYYLYPVTDEADEAEREISQLSKQVATVPPAPPELRRERAARLFEARQYRKAEEAYRQLAAASSGAARAPDLGEPALVRAGAAAFHGGRTTAALSLLSGLRPSDPAAAAERLHYLAECYRRRSDESRFLATVRQLGEQHPASPWYEEALFSAGNYFLLQRDLGQYERYYRTLYETFPKGKYAAVAHWRVAWKNYRTGDHEAARRLFEEQIVRYPEGGEVAAALYWLGRIAEERGDQNVARACLQKASDNFPQYFYGILARKKLEQAQALPAAGVMLPENVRRVLAAVPSYHPSLAGVPPPADLPSHRRKVEALETAGLIDLAIIEVRHSTDDLNHTQYLLLELARLEHDRGRFPAAFVYIRRVYPNYFAFPFEELSRSTWELLFPLPWWSNVQAGALRHGLDPYLVAALIRQESAFNPWAISRARAYGLMQLLPSTARRVAREMGRRRPSAGTLLDPVTNIELGTRYLREVLDRYDGRLEAALASYNAGPERVDAWLAQQNFSDPAAFVESIPFTETREYVQALTRNTTLYRRLYAKDVTAGR